MEKEKIPCGPIFNIKQAVENPQIKARNMIVNSYHKKIGEFKTAGNPIKMSNYKDEEKRGTASFETPFETHVAFPPRSEVTDKWNGHHGPMRVRGIDRTTKKMHWRNGKARDR